MRKKRQAGSAIVEFALVAIPLIMVWISIVQMALGMWRYHTLEYAVKMASSYMALHGGNCSVNGNTCSITIQKAATVFRNAATGIPPSTVSLTFTPYAADHVTAAGGSYPVTCTLSSCLTNTTAYPPTGYGDPGCDIEIKATYTFHSALAMVVPGSGSVHFGVFRFLSESKETVLF